MGKKTKVGKQRKDRYYKLAKEAGYRSRAAFKLVQLNKTFQFLERSQICVDLCAAPGGWSQVAAKYMPVSKLIVAIDLCPIRPMNSVVCLQGDITVDKSRAMIMKELQTRLADVVLHDGAPNVGKNWLHDAFAQIQLVLSSLKLATSLLRRGGWFVTKVFRSKDYQALVQTLEKLFKKVYVTKPQASRHESAEIFVVCQGYLKPDKVDPALLDPKQVFTEANVDGESKVDAHQELFGRDGGRGTKRLRKRADGFADEQTATGVVYRRLPASVFIDADDYVLLLSNASQVQLDTEELREHEATTEEVRQCLSDIRVLGRRELRLVLDWRKKIKREMLLRQRRMDDEGMDAEAVAEPTQEDLEKAEEDEIETAIREATTEQKRLDKKKEKKEKKERQKLMIRKRHGMVIEGDVADVPDEFDLFSLKRIRRQQQLQKTRGEADGGVSSSDDSDNDSVDGEEINEDVDAAELLLDGSDVADKPQNIATEQDDLVNGWFNKECFSGIENDDEDDAAVDQLFSRRQNQQTNENGGIEIVPQDVSSVSKNEPSDEESDSDDDDKKDEVKTPEIKRVKLDPEALALGELLTHSSKTKRDLIEFGYNRYTNNDTNLPDWFAEDERRHYRAQLPISKEAVAEYRLRERELNARPIKKVAEAKARKRKRLGVRLDKARKNMENIAENPDMSAGTKAKEMKKLYKKAVATQKKKPQMSYHVATKGKRGTAARPRGPYKVVDARLKKDTRAANAKSRGKKGGNAKKGPPSSGGGRGNQKRGSMNQRARDKKKTKSSKAGGGRNRKR